MLSQILQSDNLCCFCVDFYPISLLSKVNEIPIPLKKSLPELCYHTNIFIRICKHSIVTKFFINIIIPLNQFLMVKHFLRPHTKIQFVSTNLSLFFHFVGVRPKTLLIKILLFSPINNFRPFWRLPFFLNLLTKI